MLNQYPYPEYDGKRSIAVGILLTLITCGIYGLYWQYKQMDTLNVWLGRNDYSFWLWFFLTFLTCGIAKITGRSFTDSMHISFSDRCSLPWVWNDACVYRPNTRPLH